MQQKIKVLLELAETPSSDPTEELMNLKVSDNKETDVSSSSFSDTGMFNKSSHKSHWQINNYKLRYISGLFGK